MQLAPMACNHFSSPDFFDAMHNYNSTNHVYGGGGFEVGKCGHVGRRVSSTEAQLVCGTQVLMVVLGDAVSGWVLV